MDEKLNELFLECTDELIRIGIDILNEKKYRCGKCGSAFEVSVLY